MIPNPDATFAVRLNTNEMIERERFADFLAAIEAELRSTDFAGPNAILVVGPMRSGSIEITLGIVTAVTGVATMLLAIPVFLVALKELARDKRNVPNDFAIAIGEVLALDGVSAVDLIYRDTFVSIRKDEVPYTRLLERGRHQSINRRRVRPVEIAPEQEEMHEGRVEDEERDWVPVLEARDHPPRESASGPSGYVTSLTLNGEFEKTERPDGTTELRFVPHDTTFAPYFIVTSNTYDHDPMELITYQVVGNVTLDGDGPSTIDVLSIGPPDDALLTVRS